MLQSDSVPSLHSGVTLNHFGSHDAMFSNVQHWGSNSFFSSKQSIFSNVKYWLSGPSSLLIIIELASPLSVMP